MKFDLTFLVNPNEKSSFVKSPKFFMEKSYACSVGSSPVSHSDETESGNDHSILGTSMGTTRSASIPLPPSHVPRTQSEVQLSIDQEVAEQRDARMFDRLVNGIRERQQHQYHQYQQQSFTLPSTHWENSLEQRLSRIVQARLEPLGESSARSMEPDEQLPTEIVATEHHNHEFPHDASDAWSISGYDHEEEQGGPFTSITATSREQSLDPEEDHIQDDEGLFEMEL
jgi:hypothetical protein